MISRKEIQDAKNAELPSILKNMGVNIVKEGQNFYLYEHDSLKFFKKNGIWLYKWWSRGEVGDGIQYLMKHCEKSFNEAVRILSGNVNFNNSNQLKIIDNWVHKSNKLIETGRLNLFDAIGKQSLYYLKHERGLKKNTIQKYQLGWLSEWKQLPSKLVIPCYRSNGNLIRVKFRIDDTKSNHGRYRIMKGSNTQIPFTSNIYPNKPVIIVESELDAILIAQESGETIGVMALGGVGTNLTSKIITYLNLE